MGVWGGKRRIWELECGGIEEELRRVTWFGFCFCVCNWRNNFLDTYCDFLFVTLTPL